MKKMKKVLVCGMLFMLVCTAAFAEEELQAYVVHGKNHTIAVKLPRSDWNVNMGIANQIGIAGFFHSSTRTSNKAQSIVQMQLRIALTDLNFFKDFDDFVRKDVERILKNNEGMENSTLPWDIKRGDKYKVIVKRYKTDAFTEYDAFIASEENGYYTKFMFTMNDDEAKCAKQIAAFKRCLEETDFLGVRFSAN